jgi:hypothetical protein
LIGVESRTRCTPPSGEAAVAGASDVADVVDVEVSADPDGRVGASVEQAVKATAVAAARSATVAVRRCVRAGIELSVLPCEVERVCCPTIGRDGVDGARGSMEVR